MEPGLPSLKDLTKEALNLALSADLQGTCRRLTEHNGLAAVMRRFWECGFLDWLGGVPGGGQTKLRMVMFLCMGWEGGPNKFAPSGWPGVSDADLGALHDLLAEMGAPVRERFYVLNGDSFVDPLLINRWMKVAPPETVAWNIPGKAAPELAKKWRR